MKANVSPLTLLGCLCFLAAFACGLYGCYRQWDAKLRAKAALADLSASQALASRIVQLRLEPDRARGATRAMQELSKTIEEAARSIDITPDQIHNIQPRTPRRLGDTPYEEHPADINLEGVRLTQVFGLATALAQEGAGLQMKTLRLTPPRSGANQSEQAADEERWHAEMTLTYHVYAPKSTRRKNSSADSGTAQQTRERGSWK